MLRKIIGKSALQTLAARYYQLYLIPEQGKSKSEEYMRIVSEGGIPDGYSSAPDVFPQNFTGTKDDCLFFMCTPVGSVEGLYLQNRKDFERFIQIMVYKCEPVSVPKTMGSCALSGITNWRKIETHKKKFLEAGNPLFLWNSEFSIFTSEKNNYQDKLIIVSKGEYSAVSASTLGLSDDLWIEKSLCIRLYHECTHIICRNKFPDKRHVIWDELLADCIGLLAAFGEYNRKIALMLLGVNEQGIYIGGRLDNYLSPHEKIEDVIPNIFLWTQYISDVIRNIKKDNLQDDILFEHCLALENDFWKEVYHD